MKTKQIIESKYWNGLNQTEMNNMIKVIKSNPKINYKKLDEFYSKYKKGKAIIEADKDMKAFKKFLEWILFLIIILGIGLIIYGLIRSLC